MDEIRTASVESEELSAELATSWAEDARRFTIGLVYTAVLAAIGTALVAVALVLGVVASPLIAVGVAFAVVRRRRVRRLHGAAWHPAAG